MGDVNATSSAVALTTALRSGAISARELLESYLERIERLDRHGVTQSPRSMPIGRAKPRRRPTTRTLGASYSVRCTVSR